LAATGRLAGPEVLAGWRAGSPMVSEIAALKTETI
jgi:hypothetical protein